MAAFPWFSGALPASVTDAVVSKSAPHLNQGRVKGSIRVMSGGNFNLNSGLTIDGSLVLPGTPEIRLNVGATSPAILEGAGSLLPSNHRVTLNSGVSLGGITRRVDGEALPAAVAPVAGSGTRNVHLNQPGDSPGNFATIRTLTLNAQGSSVNLPPGRYERITINGASTVTLQGGTAGSPALYEIQQLDLNGGSRIDIAGPVELRLKNSLNANGYVGHPAHPEWLAMSISAGSFTLNSQSAFHGKLVVPGGALTVNGGSLLHGMAFTDRLTLNGGGVIECEASGGTPNLPPVATGSEVTTPVGAAVEIPLQATDPEGQALSHVATTAPMNGTVTISGATATYTPEFGFVGTDIFYFKASDGNADSEPVAVVIHVFQPNRPPSAESPVFVLNQGEANAPLTLAATDSDGDAVTYEILTQPQHGVLGGTAPALTYAHTGSRANGVISDSFTYRAVDSQGVASEVATVTLQLQPVNRPPQAPNVPVTVAEDMPIVVTLPATDADRDPLAYDFELPAGFPGTLVGEAPVLEFVPTANFHGTASFFYTATDPSGETATGEVVITVTPVNDPPQMQAGTAAGDEDQGIEIVLPATDVDGDPLTFTITVPPAHGTLVPSDTGFTYTPDADFHGEDAFSYVASDGELESAETTVTLTVNPLNDAPVAPSLTLAMDEDAALALTLPGSDADGDTLTWSFTLPEGFPGTVTGEAPALQFVPTPDFHGTAVFSFAVTDPDGESSIAEVEITVAPVNDSPIAQALTATGDEDQAIAILLAGSDGDGDLLTYAWTLPEGFPGSLSGEAPALVFHPAANFSGAAWFDFTVTDPDGETATARVDLTVQPVNDAPVASGSRAATRESASLTLPLAASDVDGDTLAFEVTLQPQHGSVVISNGQATYTPVSGFSGIDRFRYTASDGTEASAPVEVVIRVAGNPLVAVVSPVAGARFAGATPVVAKVEASDPDGDLSVVELQLDGTRVGSGNSGLLEVTLPELSTGDHTLAATVIDAGGGRTESVAVSFHVEAANRAPVVVAGSDRAFDSGSLSTNLLVNPGNEQALVNGIIPGWTVVGTAAWGQGKPTSRIRRYSYSTANVYPAAPEGTSYFHVTGDQSGELAQDIALTDSQRASVAGGGARFAFEARAFSYQPKQPLPQDYTGRPSAELPTGDLDRPEAVVEFRDEAGELLASHPAAATVVGDQWLRFGTGALIPAATSTIRVRLIATKADSKDTPLVVFVAMEPAEKNDALFDAVTLRIGGPQQQFLHGSVADDGLPTGSIVASRWSQLSGPAAMIGEPARATSPVIFPAPGDYEFQLEAGDGQLTSADTVRIRIDSAATNLPPVVTAGPDLTEDFRATIPLAGSVSDDSTGLTVGWSQISGPADVAFANPLRASTTVSVPLPGLYLLKLSAFDGEWSGEDLVVVEATASAQRQPLDVVITMDHSGSMWALKADGDPTTPIAKSREAASLLISRLDPATDRVGVRRITGGMITPLSHDLGLARTSIIQPQGEPGAYGSFQPSNIDTGIQGALNHLLATPRSGPPDRVIIVFNDGAGPYSDGAARAAREAGVRVIVVSFSNGIDAIDTANMRLQASTPGDFIAAETPEEALRLLAILLETLRLPVNTPPQVNAGAVIRLAEVADTAFLAGAFSDDGLPGEVTPIIAWEQLACPAPATLSDPQRLNPRVTFSAAGEYRFKLSVSDGERVASDTVLVQVARPPGLPAPVGITSWWPFDGNLRDVAGPSNLSRYGWWDSPRFTPGAVNDAVQFLDGTDVLTAGPVGDIGLNSADGFSIEFRFKARTNTPGYLFTLFNPATGMAGRGISWGHTNFSNAVGNLYFLSPPATATSNHGDIKLTATTLPLNAWHHAILTHNRRNNETWLYLNGQGRRVFTAAIGPHFSQDHLLYLGGLPPTRNGLNTLVTTDPQRRFDGDLDDFAFYARPLDPFEVQQLHESAPQGKQPPAIDRAPVVDAGTNLRVEGLTASLNGFVSDDTTEVSIMWSQVSGPGTTTFADPSAPVTMATFDVPGIYTLKLTASDLATSSSDLVQVHVALPSATSAPTGLVAWMPGNRHTRDLITGRTGMWSGLESYAPVKAGEGFQFGNGISRVRYLPPDAAPPDTGRGFTIEAWMSLPANVTSYGADALSFPSSAGTKLHHLELVQFAKPTGGTEPGFNWMTSNSTGGGGHTIQVRSLPLGVPFHLALTYDPVTTRKRAYVNGVPVSDQVSLGGTFHHFDKECYVGSTPGEPEIFPGKIDELSFYNIALTPAQVLAISQAGGSGKFPPPATADPRVDAGADLALVPGESHSFAPLIDTGTFTAGPLATAWTKVSGPGPVSFDNPSQANATVTVAEAGRHVVRLTVTDGTVTVADEVTIDVVEIPNAPPVIAALPESVSLQLPDARAELDPLVTDDGRPDGQLEHRWIQLDALAPVSFTAPGGFRTQAVFSAPGDYTLVLEASDGLATARRQVTVHVAAAPPPPVPNQAPQVAAGGDFEAQAASFLLEGTVSDDGKPAGQPVISAWSLVSGPGLVSFTDAADPATTAAVKVPGTYRLRLYASDGELSASDEVVITVPASAAGLPNKAPKVTLPGSLTGNLPNLAVTLQPTVADDGRSGQPLAFAWTLLDGPATADIATPAAETTDIHFAVAGDYVFELRVSDGELSAVARTTIVVLPPGNTAPVVALAPAGPAKPYETAELSATVTDDGQPGTPRVYQWRQISGPELAFIDDPHAETTSVTFGAGGSYLFEFSASDGALTSRATVAWNVIGVPDIRIVSPDNGMQITDRTLMALQASASIDGGRIVSVRFEKDGNSVGAASRIGTSDDWLLQLPPLGIGSHTLTAVAASADGQSATSAPVTFEIVDFEEQALTVDILSPFDGDLIAGPVEVTGSAYSARLASWNLSISSEVPVGSPQPAATVIASGTGTVLDGPLGTLDPSLLQNGTYRLTLSATTTAGTSSSYSLPIIIEGNLKIGHFTLAFDDLTLPAPGLPLTVTRTYDSRDARAGDFGPSWNVGLRSIRIRKAGRLGEGWEQTQNRSGFFPLHAVQPTTRKRVVVSFPDGRTEAFEPVFRAPVPVSESQPNVQKVAEISAGTLGFRAVAGSKGTLEVEGVSDIIWNGPIPGRGTVIDITFNPANPTRFRYTEPEGTSYVIDEILGLVSLSEPNGNTLQIHSGGIFHSNGDQVLFTRNASGRITEVTDPAGAKILYGYDGQGRLTTVTDRVGEVTTFRYENPNFSHYLTSILDPRGIPAIRSEYDEDGRLIAQTDAAGQTVEFEHDLADNREIVRDRLGNVTVHEYDDRGNVTRTTDALGGVTRYTYDANDNEASVTSPLGFTTIRSYDGKDNLLSETDPLGNVTRYTYDSSRLPLTIADALGQTTRLGYSFHGNLLSMQDPDGTPTGFGYDGRGNVTRITDALGTSTNTTHNSKGNELTSTVTDAAGNVLRTESHTYDASGNRVTSTLITDHSALITSYAYDAANRLTLTTYPDGSTLETIYNAIGKPWKTIDAAGRETVMTYDARGHLVRTDFPDGTFTTAAFDAEGRQTAATDAAGLTTYTLYDVLGRSVATILPDETMPATVITEVADIASSPELADNPRSATSYDADGRVTATTDPHGHSTTFEYDSAGRRTATIDALGHRFTTAYDAAGRQASTTDAKGYTTVFAYDAAGRLTRTTFPDGTFTTTGYDALGRRTSATDQNGNVTTFEYDAQGRLIAVVDAEGGRTSYDYDTRGLQTTQRDALGRETRYVHDAMGRRTGRTLPSGQAESYAYDLLGRLTGHTDFNGHTTTREYDPLNDRLLAVAADSSHPSLALTHAPARHEFGYDVLGRRTAAAVKNAAGAVLHADTWSYDLHSRPTVQASTTGTLRYAWDATGTLAGVKSDTPGGYDLSYDYDALNRLTTVHHGQEGVDPASYPLAAYGYDANGKLAGVSYANQVTHAYAYDALNRLTGLTVDRQPGASGGQATALHGYAYTLNAAGHRTGIAELGGRTIAHTYDRLHRLASESISSLITDHRSLGTVAYTYDRVGNRLTRTSSGGLSDLLPNQTHQHDANDRLTHHGYDANGNTTGSADLQSATSLSDTYSFDNRLIRRERGDGLSIDILYNTDGDRVAKWVKQGSLNLRVHHYLVDRVNLTGYAQVLEEKDGTGQLVARHLYGHDLIASDLRNLESSISDRQWYCYDGLGSVRGLSDDDGILQETYDFDAYGILIGLAKRDATTGGLVAQDLPSSISHPRSEYLFTGEQWDRDLGMYFLRARYLNPDRGRFHTMDTYEGRNGEPLSLHKYLYAHANPVSHVDPSGQAVNSQEQALATSLTSKIGGLSAGVMGAFRISVSAGYHALRTLGIQVELGVARILANRAAVTVLGSSGAAITRISGPGGNRIIDFLIRIRDRLYFIEVKASIPTRAGDALFRLVGQIQSATAQQNVAGTVVFYFRGAPADLQRVINLVGQTGHPVTYINGFRELIKWLNLVGA